MAKAYASKSAAVRARLSHPVASPVTRRAARSTRDCSALVGIACQKHAGSCHLHVTDLRGWAGEAARPLPPTCTIILATLMPPVKRSAKPCSLEA